MKLRIYGSDSSDLRLSAKSKTHESSCPVESTSDNVARNCICPTSTIAIVADGAWTDEEPCVVTIDDCPCGKTIDDNEKTRQ